MCQHGQGDVTVRYERRFSKQPVSDRPTSQATGNATRRDSKGSVRMIARIDACQR
jgi:hypothetical protein